AISQRFIRLMLLQNMLAFTGLKGIPEISFLRITKCRKLGIPIFATILAKRQTASGSTSLNMLISMPENMLRYPNISTKEHLRLHLVNLYDSFLDCWPKTNCKIVRASCRERGETCDEEEEAERQ